MQLNIKKSTIYQVFYTHIKTYIVLYVNYISIKLEEKNGNFHSKHKKPQVINM